MGKHTTTMIIHGLTTKFTPLFFVVIAFLFISDYTRESLAGISPENAFVGSILIIGGLIFLYEGIFNLPDAHKSSIGAIGAVIFFVLVALNVIFGLAIIFNYYDPFLDSGDVNFLLQIILFADIIMLLSEGIYEIIFSRRLSIHRVAQF